MHHTFLNGLSKPISMAILGEDVFWTTAKTSKLYWTPKHNLGGTKKLIIQQPPEVPVPDEILLLSVTPLHVSNHRCQSENGGCSHICVSLGNTSFACVCPSGMVFKDYHNQTCIVVESCEFRFEHKIYY